jgi:hypothetical protein
VKKHNHLSDEDLLLLADGELGKSSIEAASHLESCSSCRHRMTELETALATVAEAHSNHGDRGLPAAGQSRASLQARLAEMSAASSDNHRRAKRIAFPARTPRILQWGSVAAAALVLAVFLRPTPPQPASTLAGLWEKPNLHLTPGATVAVTANQVCGGSAVSGEPMIPISLEKKVLELYGVTRPQPDQYEIDYLITPELGGATDVRNLWPEPYHDAVWNAHVKDQLEDRLHQMVCRGDVDLATAQRDISTDWIAAYRKYFHADTPVSDGSGFNPGSAHSLPST